MRVTEFPEAFPGGIRVELARWDRRGGAVLLYNVGSVGNPMSAAEICAKFLDCAGTDCGQQQSNGCWQHYAGWSQRRH